MEKKDKKLITPFRNLYYSTVDITHHELCTIFFMRAYVGVQYDFILHGLMGHYPKQARINNVRDENLGGEFFYEECHLYRKM